MFNVLSETPWGELEPQIRAVSLLQQRNGQTIYPYETADIQLEEVPFAQLRPTSLYVVASHLQSQHRLVDDLALQGYDPLALQSMLQVSEDNRPPIGMIPPIIEVTASEGMYVLDGMHRTYLGWQSGRLTLLAIVIRGIRDDCPASARPNEWIDMIEYSETPRDNALKRRYRDNHLAYRRDFSRLNGSQPRL